MVHRNLKPVLALHEQQLITRLPLIYKRKRSTPITSCANNRIVKTNVYAQCGSDVYDIAPYVMAFPIEIPNPKAVDALQL